MNNKPYRKILVMILVFTLVMTNLMSALVFAAPPGNGEFKITDQPASLVEANHFDEKDDVYIYSDGNMTDGEYYVKVTGPNSNDLLGDSLPNTVTVTSGNFGPINLWALTGGYDDTPNSGGIYKIHMSPNDEFPNSDTFTKTFTVEVPLGQIEVLKNVPELNDLTVFEFNLINEQEEVLGPFSFSEEESAMIELPYGTYTVTEVPHEGYSTTTDSYSNIVVDESSSPKVTFENIPVKTNGTLRINKDVPNVEEDSTEFEFNIFIPGESEPFMILNGSEVSDALAELPEGFYHISETPMEGYTTTTPGYRNIEIVVDEVTDVYFENILDNTVGGLQIYKDVPNLEEDPTEFDFNIFIPGQSEPFLVLSGSEVTNAYTRLPEGFYHISETPMQGYTTTTPGYRNIEVVAGEVTDVYFENILDNTIGGLQIYKDVPNVREDRTEFEFNLFIPGESEPFLVLDGSEVTNAYTRLSEGFYHISETPMEGYTTTTPGYRNIEVVAGEVTDVYFENILDERNGELNIYKEVPNVTDDPTVFDFNIYQSTEQEPILIDTVQASEINSGMITLPTGFYTVTEVANENYISDTSEYMVEVSFTTSSSVTFYNYSMDASLGIVKTVDDSSISPGQDAEYTVVVTNTGSTLLENILVTDVFDDEEATIIDENLTLEAGQSKTYNYTVEDISRGTHVNVATAEIIESEIDPVSDDASVTASTRRRDPPSTYSVSGYVFEDFNSDNEINDDDFGYEGILVELFDDEGDLIDTDVTDSNGRYSFSDLRGSYKIAINLNESQVSEYDGLLDQTVELSINKNTSQVNFGFNGSTPLALPTIIAGTVFNDINEDNMVDVGEIGYSNVEVTLWAGTTPVLTKMTDANGQYVFNFLIDPELADLEPGDYIVSIGQVPVGVTEVSEYDATLNLMVQLVLEEDTEAIVNVNFGFKTSVVPSGEEANVAMILIGLILLSSGVILRKKSFSA